ncbi:DUF1877 family protein [Streptomyces fulvoviolaceus]|uniref:DUF1877 family protein n=1 Tax=Streptomyces fulvoviolaceus TaxID=285535 RepID=UPI0004C8FC22|nr:DUF1877 family protein [Streptomyces fulvoviolaceus]
MNTYLHLRAVHPSALRNSTTWLQRLFEDDWDTVRHRIDRHREEMLDGHYLDHELLYAGAQVVLGGHPVSHPDPKTSPFLLLTAAQVTRVAEFLTDADFEALWQEAREELLKPYGDTATEPEVQGAFAAAHRDLTAFYERTALYGDAVVKWLIQ